MSGNLSARNHPDGGAVFEIELPAVPGRPSHSPDRATASAA
jgi:hypothetical protein